MPPASSPPVQVDRLLDDLETLARFGQCGDRRGVNRPAFSAAYRQASDWLMEVMREAGLQVRMDATGNIIGRLGPSEGPAVVCGSHIDSVPNAGKLDGTLGVLAGVEIARCRTQENATFNRALEVVAFMDDEGAFLGELGARAMIGDLASEDIETCSSRGGARLLDAVAQFGLDSSKLKDAARLPECFHAYVELHIEQGPVLDIEGIDIGIVENIVGIQVNELHFQSQANHAGTTPMSDRHDAFRAAAETATIAFETLERDFPPDLRLTYGVSDVKPGAYNVVPSSARAMQEIRAGQELAIDAAYDMTMQTAQSTAEKLGVSVKSRLVSRDPVAKMSNRVSDLIENVCQTLNLSVRRMLSGAGHDAQILAQVCDAGMIFVPSVNGISHNPAEYTSPTQVEAGVAVLYETVRSLLFE